eukprot:Hpha_TRINITY_DN15336_c0_g5::TRINITY_DN15336_c0_g5_i1::g.87975::m.87975
MALAVDGNLHPEPLSPEQRQRMKERRIATVEAIRGMTLVKDARFKKEYEAKRRLGAGTFGTALLCVRKATGQQVVVKVAQTPISGSKQEYDAKKELWAMQQLTHPNVVRMIESWVEDEQEATGGRLHICMELCDAGDLGGAIKNKQRTPEAKTFRVRVAEVIRSEIARRRLNDADPVAGMWKPSEAKLILSGGLHDGVAQLALRTLSKGLNRVVSTAWRTAHGEGKGLGGFTQVEIESWMVQLLWALWHIHKVARTMHRDVKPDNIFLSHGGSILKLGDFGLAGLAMVTGAEAMTIQGTPLYMAPEMHVECAKYTDRIDTFAAGVTMYQVATLSYPWDGSLPGWCYDTARFRESNGGPDATWGLVGRQACPRFLRRQLATLDLDPPCPPPEMVEPGLFDVIMSMLSKVPAVRPTVGQVLRCKRVVPVARQVVSVLASIGVSEPEGLGEDEAASPRAAEGEVEGGDDMLEFLAVSDARHGNAVNPADRIGAFLTPGGKGVYPCRTGAEVYRGKGIFTVRVRESPEPTAVILGKLPPDAVIEVYEKTPEDAAGQVWFKIRVASGDYGWIISRSLPPHFRFDELFDLVPEHLVDRAGKAQGRVSPVAAIAEEAASALSEAVLTHSPGLMRTHADPSRSPTQSPSRVSRTRRDPAGDPLPPPGRPSRQPSPPPPRRTAADDCPRLRREPQRAASPAVAAALAARARDSASPGPLS